jgi:hypothetical protein
LNWEAIGATGEVLGSIAVVVTLAYLAIQIRQNTQSNRTAAIQTMAAQDSSWLSGVAQDGELSEILGRGWRDFAGLAPVEQGRFAALMSQVCRQYDSQLHLWRDGAIPEGLWTASLNTLRFVHAQTGFRQWWTSAKQLYSADFQALVDGLDLPGD